MHLLLTPEPTPLLASVSYRYRKVEGLFLRWLIRAATTAINMTFGRRFWSGNNLIRGWSQDNYPCSLNATYPKGCRSISAPDEHQPCRHQPALWSSPNSGRSVIRGPVSLSSGAGTETFPCRQSVVRRDVVFSVLGDRYLCSPGLGRRNARRMTLRLLAVIGSVLGKIAGISCSLECQLTRKRYVSVPLKEFMEEFISLLMNSNVHSFSMRMTPIKDNIRTYHDLNLCCRHKTPANKNTSRTHQEEHVLVTTIQRATLIPAVCTCKRIWSISTSVC